MQKKPMISESESEDDKPLAISHPIKQIPSPLAMVKVESKVALGSAKKDSKAETEMAPSEDDLPLVSLVLWSAVVYATHCRPN